MHGRLSVIQIDGYSDCTRFIIRNKYHAEKISIFLIKVVYSIKIYIEVYHLWLGSEKDIVNTKNC